MSDLVELTVDGKPFSNNLDISMGVLEDTKLIKIKIHNNSPDDLHDIEFHTTYPMQDVVIPDKIPSQTTSQITFTLSKEVLWEFAAKQKSKKPMMQSVKWQATRTLG